MKATACVMTGVLVAALGCGRSAPSAPVITRQPQDARIPGCGSAAFAVSADGTGPLSYQWSKNGAPIAWASGSTYSLSNALPSEDGSTYSVTVSNPGGEATSRRQIPGAMLPADLSIQPHVVDGLAVNQPTFIQPRELRRCSKVPGTTDDRWIAAAFSRPPKTRPSYFLKR